MNIGGCGSYQACSPKLAPSLVSLVALAAIGAGIYLIISGGITHIPSAAGGGGLILGGLIFEVWAVVHLCKKKAGPANENNNPDSLATKPEGSLVPRDASGMMQPVVVLAEPKPQVNPEPIFNIPQPPKPNPEPIKAPPPKIAVLSDRFKGLSIPKFTTQFIESTFTHHPEEFATFMKSLANCLGTLPKSHLRE